LIPQERVSALLLNWFVELASWIGLPFVCRNWFIAPRCLRAARRTHETLFAVQGELPWACL
jgi:hypothetical protein